MCAIFALLWAALEGRALMLYARGGEREHSKSRHKPDPLSFDLIYARCQLIPLCVCATKRTHTCVITCFLNGRETKLVPLSPFHARKLVVSSLRALRTRTIRINQEWLTYFCCATWWHQVISCTTLFSLQFPISAQRQVLVVMMCRL